MSLEGQSRSFGDVASMSELPSIAVVERTSAHGSKVPGGDIVIATSRRAALVYAALLGDQERIASTS
jgi:hypothetical protein